jgi:uncharacterized protein (DUF488 family)
VPTIYTVGHSTRSLEALIALLRAAGIQSVADVRRWPVSARHPHFAAAPLEAALVAAGLAYHQLGRTLGGYRPSGYEAHMQTAEFAQGLDTLERLAAPSPLAVL